MTPTRELLRIAYALCAGALLVAFFPAWGTLWTLVASAVAGVTLIDYFVGRRPARLELAREVGGSVPLGVWSEVALQIVNREGRDLRLTVHDHHPLEFEAADLPRSVSLPAERRIRIPYRVRPNRRGDAVFPRVDLVVTSPMGLWRNKQSPELESRVKVFPNFREISHFALLATDNRLSQIGVRRRQRRGEGSDFHQLREYRAGDSLRQIDWKATSRYQKLISKEYQDERDQQIVFLLDCGRRMRHQEEGRVHLDQALNSMLLLAYVAARQDDAVGFMAFGGPRRWYPPRKSGHVVKALLEQTYDLDSTTEAADYLVAAKELLTLQRRRALIVLMTNTRDEDQHELLQAVQLLAKRHLVVLADLRESLLDETLDQPVRTLDDALTFQAVNEYLATRGRHHEALRYHGALTLDILAPELPVALVNQYLNIKATGKL